MSAILTEIITLITGALTGIGTAIGSALSEMASAIFLNTAGTGLSTFGGLIAIFAALSLGFTLTRWVLNFITSFGKRNR